MTDSFVRSLRAAVRAVGGAVRETPAGFEFYRNTKYIASLPHAPVSVIVGVWDGRAWRPVVGDPAPCDTYEAAVALYVAACAAGVEPPKPMTAAQVNAAAKKAAVQAGVASARGVPRNRGRHALRHVGAWDQGVRD